jgi:hypothetical protein
MVSLKCTPGFLYQIANVEERARQQRDRKRESVRGRALLEVRDSISKNRPFEKMSVADL